MKTLSLFFCGLVVGLCGFGVQAADNRIIEGTVIDAQTKLPVQGAKVELFWHEWQKRPPVEPHFIKSKESAKTDSNGRYRFEVSNKFDSSGNPDVALVAVFIKNYGVGIGYSFVWQPDPAKSTDIELYKPWSLEGKILDAEGKGIANARVGVAECNLKKPGYSRYHATEMFDILSAKTDAAGHFRIDNIPQSHEVKLRVDKPGCGIAYTGQMAEDRFSANEQQLNPLQITLYPAAHIGGVLVRQSDRVALGNTPIILAGLNPNGSFYPMRACDTDKEGKFLFENLSPGQYQLNYMAYRDIRPYPDTKLAITVEPGQSLKDVQFEIPQGGEFVLQVLDSATQKPIESASFEIQDENQRGFGAGTDPNGMFMQALNPGNYILKYISVARYTNCPKDVPFCIEAGKRTTLAFELTPRPLFEGVVNDPEGNPLAGAEVLLWAKGNYWCSAEKPTDAQGRFSCVWSSKFAQKPDSILAQHPQKNLAVYAPYSQDNFRISLLPAIKVIGSIQDADGQPISDASLSVGFREPRPLPTSPYGFERSKQIKTDSAGNFVCPAIPHQMDVTCLFFIEGFTPVLREMKSEQITSDVIDFGTITLEPKKQ